MRRFRRKRRGTWLPPIGTVIAGEEVAAGRYFTLTAGAGSNMPLIILPLLYDVPQFEDSTVTTNVGLSTLVGNEYMLRRIVGKLHIRRLPFLAGGKDDGTPLIVSAGFFVARAGDKSTPGAVDQPVGALASSSVARDNYGVLDNDNIREPWIWRRTWVLGTNERGIDEVTQTAFQRGLTQYPGSTDSYGALGDGAHVDAKTRRRVSQEDRLWLAVSFIGETFQTVIAGEAITGFTDLRFFGELRRSHNRGNF